MVANDNGAREAGESAYDQWYWSAKREWPGVRLSAVREAFDATEYDSSCYDEFLNGWLSAASKSCFGDEWERSNDLEAV